MSEEEVDLVVVHDHVRSEEICKALKQAGIHHVEFWPEDILSPSIGIAGHGVMEPVFGQGTRAAGSFPHPRPRRRPRPSAARAVEQRADLDQG